MKKDKLSSAYLLQHTVRAHSVGTGTVILNPNELKLICFI